MHIRAPLHRLLLAGGIVAMLSACPPPNTNSDGGDTDAGCAGTIGCECASGSCTTGECVGGTCTDCRRGEAACTCRANGTCNSGLRCASGACQVCPGGEMGCPCNVGDTCNTGLTCSSGTCVTDTCVAGAMSCPCRGADPKCDGDQYCDGTMRCQTCSNDVVGCPCVSGACTGQTTCDTTTNKCRTPLSCADLVTAGTCVAHQACTQANGSDATCTAACEAGYKWTGTTCLQCSSPNCANEPVCAGDGGLDAMTCSVQHRSCSEASGTAACGACLSGYTLDPVSNNCVAAPTCGAATCTLQQYCDSSSGTPTCAALPCTGQNSVDPVTNNCTPCTRMCTGPGLSGRLWPFKAGDTSCVCETLDGYFFTSGNNGTAVKCDADNDGWVHQTALAVRADARALRPNSRCNIRTIDRARLYDEYGESIDVLSCATGLVKASALLADGGLPNGGSVGILPDGGLVAMDGGAACTFLPLPLVETEANDTGTRTNPLPAYGGVNGRTLQANELNSLTKACVAPSLDFNDNGISDMSEVQTDLSARPGGGDAERVRLESFSYFTELNTAYVEGRVLVIRERSRCDNSFPFHYATDGGAEPYVSDAGAPYWRTCSRNREVNFNLASPTPGFDFAQFDCDYPSGACTLAPPPHPTIVAPTSPDRVLMRKHGLCDLGGNLPADGLWRGMTHHSQYKCVNVVSVIDVNSKPFDTLDTRFNTAQDGGLNMLTLNTCAAAQCGDGGVCTTAQGQGLQTSQPVLNCTARATATAGQVGFAAVNFKTGPYVGGCVNEDLVGAPAWNTYLCPQPTYSLNAAAAEANFGRYSCFGRPANFLWCGTPCNETISTLRWAPTTKGQNEPTGTPVFR